VTKAALKALFIGIVLVVLEEFSGCYLLLYRIGSIFDSFEGVSADIASIIIGFIQVVGAYCSTFLIKRLGRKILTVSSAIGIAAGMLLTGFTIPLNDGENSSLFYKSLPVAGIALAIFCANVGVFVLTYIVLAEITPSKVKEIIKIS
jgi:MFS family permease